MLILEILNWRVKTKLATNKRIYIVNRKKKINQALKKRLKKTNAKLHKSNKEKYISKADRAKLEINQELKIDQTDEKLEDQ